MIDRDFPVIEEALRGDDLALRRAALRAVRTLPVADDAAAATLTDASLELRRAFYRTLSHARRTALADRLLPAVRQQWGDGEAAALLSAVVGDEAALAVQSDEAVVGASGSSVESAEPALSRLLAEANGARSPEAVAALAACCAKVRPSALGPALVSALFASDSKITLRKQAVHQLRRDRVPGHLDVLLRAWQQPDTRRDVRVATGVVLRGATEDPRAGRRRHRCRS